VRHLPEQVAEILGVWHWGNTAYSFAFDGRELVVTALAGRAEAYRFRLREDGELVGTSGYHHGETLYVERGADDRVSHLRCATFIYTRTPYDRAAPIPGGAPEEG